ncbi:hypothetical protein C8Q72DRAFT_660558 [Fomitopsis betulina]|nr:hypothetical protein C8Q72DRAFT_660558 [Fomitopsis betulina]
MPHRLTKIDDARVFFGIVGSLFGSGYTVWLTLVAPHRNRLRQAKKFIEEISQTVNALTEDDKIAIDKYIAQVTAKDAKNTGCLLDTQHMFEELEKAQKQHTAVSEELKAHPSIQFPWSDLASSILALLDQCRDLHRSVQQSTTQGLQHRVQVSTPSSIVSSPIQQSPATSTTSSFIQQPRTSSATNSSFIPHPQASSATISSFIQHSQTSSATISSFIQQPPSTCFSSGPDPCMRSMEFFCRCVFRTSSHWRPVQSFRV